MRIAVGCDHRGLKLKGVVLDGLKRMGHTYQDFGSYDASSVDYPDFALKVAEGVAGGRFEHGILLCATGIGMSIAANKVKGIRAALCCDASAAQRARSHNDANVLCLGGEVVGEDLAREITEMFLTTPFEGGRHQRRLEKVAAMEGC